MTTTATKKTAEGIDQWRDYFRSANADIFEIIERAITVAATDFPDEFSLRRGRLALFAAECNRVEAPAVEPNLVLEGEGGWLNFRGVTDFADGTRADGHLNPDIELVKEVLDGVSETKEILNNYKDKPDSVLLDALLWLQVADLNYEVLKATRIEKTLKAMLRHGSKRIRYQVLALLEEWKAIVDDWEQAGPGEPEEDTSDSKNSSVVKEEEEEIGIPSPPLNEGALFTTQNINFDQCEQLVDGMDFDGNPPSNEEESVSKPLMLHCEQNVEPVVEAQERPDSPPIRRRPAPQVKRTREAPDENSVGAKPETSKRKLQEPYEEAEKVETAKKQRRYG